MISEIINSYFSILASIGFGSICLFFLGTWWIIKKPKPRRKQQAALIQPAPIVLGDNVVTDCTTFSGEDVFATQLDLARAYIETGKTSVAKKILSGVIKKGTAIHQEEAQRLLQLT